MQEIHKDGIIGHTELELKTSKLGACFNVPKSVDHR
jgi:hypothetical protein